MRNRTAKVTVIAAPMVPFLVTAAPIVSNCFTRSGNNLITVWCLLLVRKYRTQFLCIQYGIGTRHVVMKNWRVKESSKVCVVVHVMLQRSENYVVAMLKRKGGHCVVVTLQRRKLCCSNAAKLFKNFLGLIVGTELQLIFYNIHIHDY